MARPFYNYTCSIYALSTSTVRGSLVKVKTIVYTNIDCALWKEHGSRYDNTDLATSTNLNRYEINLKPQYTDIAIGYIVTIDSIDYTVDNVIKHHNSKGNLDNLEVHISKSTNG
jgi:hypothetical protein